MEHASLSLLGLSKKEGRVFEVLQGGLDTPVRIAKETNISRPAIYAILKQFEKRGLASSRLVNGSRRWTMASAQQLDEMLFAFRSSISKVPDGKRELYKETETTIALYRGKKAVNELLQRLFAEHRGERLRGFQGDNVYPAWRDLLGLDSIAAMNKSIKKNGLIVEAILPEGFFPRAITKMGTAWAKDFEGRTYRASLIGEEYFAHGAEVFLFKDSAYLISMKEALIIEIRHSEIQKMLGLIINYVQDNSKSVDGNDILRKLMDTERKVVKE